MSQDDDVTPSNRRVLERFFARKENHARLVGVARRLRGPGLERRVSAETVASLVKIKALGSAGTMRAITDEDIERFLWTLTRNVIASEARRYRSLKRDVALEAPLDSVGPLAAGGLSPTGAAALKQELELVAAFAEQVLPNGQLKALTLLIAGCSYEDIGRELGISAEAARRKCARALKVLDDAKKRGKFE